MQNSLDLFAPRTSSRRFSLGALLVFCSFLLLVACGNRDDGAARFERIESIGVTLDGSGVRQMQAIGQMEGRIAGCMQESGWQYEPVDAEALFVPGVSYFEEPARALTLVERAGYEIAIDVLDPAYGGIDASYEYVNASYEASLDSSEAELYFLKLEECRVKIMTPYEDLKLSLRGAYKTEVLDVLWSSVEMKEATQGWLDCMGTAGYPDLVSLDGAQQTAATNFETWASGVGFGNGESPELTGLSAASKSALQRVFDEELNIARSDIRCLADELAEPYSVRIAELDAVFAVSHSENLSKIARFWVEEG